MVFEPRFCDGSGCRERDGGDIITFQNMELQAGTRLGSYEVVDRLGAGSMGEVYRARDLKLRRDVALKVLPDELAKNDERLRRFEQEALTASSLSHPNVIHVYDIGEDDGEHFVAMELVKGRTLREVLDSGPLPFELVLDYGCQIAEGLAKTHSVGVIPRDVKPENLIVSDDATFVRARAAAAAPSTHPAPSRL